MLLKDCLPHLLYEFKSEAELIKAVEEISLKFTLRRENITDYLKGPRLVSAYTAFYFTTNWPKLAEVFKWMPHAWIEEIKKCDFIDLGAGPGTFSLAFADIKGKEGKIYQIENSRVMREQARKLWDGIRPHVPMEHMTLMRKAPGSFLLFGHSANEMGAEEAIKYIKEIDPDHILFIEPGTKSYFKEMLKIRSYLLENRFNVIFPCPSSGQCPLRDSEEDWCHQFIQAKHSKDVERLSQLVKKDRRLLPLTAHAYSRTFGHKDRERIVRVHPATKFSYEWEVCTGERIERYQAMKRGFDKKTQKNFDEVLAGASLETEIDKVLKGYKRVRVFKINNKDVCP